LLYGTDMGGFALNFVHKRLIGAAKGLIASGGNPLAAVAGFAGGGAQAVIAPAMQKVKARSLKFGAWPGSPAPSLNLGRKTAHRALHKARKVALRLGLPDPGHGRHAGTRAIVAPAAAPCVWPMRIDPLSGECRAFIGSQSGRDPTPVGDAIMGRYGAAYQPGSLIVDRAVCLPGDVVGDDGLCYPKAALKNSEREWPRGRRPLLTGGEMRAISIASRAAGRMTRTAVRLQEIGLIKKPIVRKRIKKKN